MTRSEISQRKADHIRLAASDAHQSHVSAGWDEIALLHDALPSGDAAEVDLAVDLLGHRLRLPVVIAGMTGGHPDAQRINATLGRLAQRSGVAMGVGSQRAALRDPGLAATYAAAREAAPDAMLIANVGVAQLVEQDGQPAFDRETLRRAVDMIAADALVVHLNYLEESVQPEGQTRAAGVLEALTALSAQLGVPIILKETGAGISRAVSERARAAGVAAVDVGGLGGTSFASIEAARAEAAGDHVRARLGATFSTWGIPTAVCVIGSAGILPVIATGGIRSGLDAAKAIALGASAVGIGRPLLQAALEGEDATDRWMEAFEQELRTAVFLTGGRVVGDLRSAPRVLSGTLLEWIRQLGYEEGTDA